MYILPETPNRPISPRLQEPCSPATKGLTLTADPLSAAKPWRRVHQQTQPPGRHVALLDLSGDRSPDGGWAIAVDSQGNAFVAGNARSTTFPTTPGAYQTAGKGGTCGVYSSNLVPYPCSDAFVLKLSPQGNSLLYSTLLGGSEDDIASGIAIDSTGNIYLSGRPEGPTFQSAEVRFRPR